MKDIWMLLWNVVCLYLLGTSWTGVQWSCIRIVYWGIMCHNATIKPIVYGNTLVQGTKQLYICK